MPKSVTVRKISAKDLSPSLRRRFDLAPDEEVSITVRKRSARKTSRQSDPWIDIRGTLSPDEAEELVLAIHH